MTGHERDPPHGMVGINKSTVGHMSASTYCVFDTVRWYQRREDGIYVGFSVECVAEDHNDREFGACPGERDLFEYRQDSTESRVNV